MNHQYYAPRRNGLHSENAVSGHVQPPNSVLSGPHAPNSAAMANGSGTFLPQQLDISQLQTTGVQPTKQFVSKSAIPNDVTSRMSSMGIGHIPEMTLQVGRQGVMPGPPTSSSNSSFISGSAGGVQQQHDRSSSYTNGPLPSEPNLSYPMPPTNALGLQKPQYVEGHLSNDFQQGSTYTRGPPVSHQQFSQSHLLEGPPTMAPSYGQLPEVRSPPMGSMATLASQPPGLLTQPSDPGFMSAPPMTFTQPTVNSEKAGPVPGGYPPSQLPQYQAGLQLNDYSRADVNPLTTMSTRPPYPGQQPSHPMQAQQQRRLDPEQMPSPIQVMLDDQKSRSGEFFTSQKGQVPPLVTTNFVTKDQGISGPRFIRSTMYSIPATPEMMKQTAVPFGLVVAPLAEVLDGEMEPPVIDTGEMGPVRCVRCKAYMCPFMQFIDGGRRFQCAFCKATAEVPPEYFQHLDHTGQRIDKYDRPELCLGTYEFVATKEYCRNNVLPKPPAYIFVIDVSYNNMKSGMVNLLCSEMKDILRHLPRDVGYEKSDVKVGFITYNSSVHFYNIKSCLSQPQMLVVGDVNDIFMPLLDGFLCDAEESDAVIDSLMEQIPLMFAGTNETEIVLGSAIQAGIEAIKASECSGKIIVFQSSLPVAEAPGKLKNRDDRKLLGTDKEKSLLAPQTSFYTTLGQQCVSVGCSVDQFIFNNTYVDIATVGQVARLSGGQVHKYTYFQIDIDGVRFIDDLKRSVGRQIAFDAIMRVRTSTGVRATDFYGSFYMSNTTDMEMGSIDCDKAVALEIKHDDKLTEEDGVYIQVALLFTSVGGQRRLRLLNLSLNTCTQMADLYRNCELDTIINFFSKQSMVRLLEQSPQAVRDNMVNRCAQMLACYRKHCASPSSAGQLILPECLKVLPLYINCLLKSDAVAGGRDMATDDRSFVMQAVLSMDVNLSVGHFYPRLIPVHDLETTQLHLPKPLRCSSEKLSDDGVFLLENGIHMFLWIGNSVSSKWLQNIFGVQSASQIDVDKSSLPEFNNPLSNQLRGLLGTVRSERRRHMKLTLVRQREKMEFVFRHFLVEDRNTDGNLSYIDFLCHMHKEIRTLLS